MNNPKARKNLTSTKLATSSHNLHLNPAVFKPYLKFTNKKAIYRGSYQKRSKAYVHSRVRAHVRRKITAHCNWNILRKTPINFSEIVEPETTMVSLDVINLYTSMSQYYGIELSVSGSIIILRKLLVRIKKDFIVKSIKFIHRNAISCLPPMFISKYYGIAMGTRAAPDNTNLTIDDIELTA